MFGIFLIAFGTLFTEVATAIGKYEVEKRKESIYSLGFLSLLWAWAFFLVLLLVRGNFSFALAALPTFLLRAALEVLQCYVSIRALTVATRSTFGFLRLVTIPLLLLTDLFIVGVSFSGYQVAGMILLLLALGMLTLQHGVERKGALLVIVSAVNAVSTLTLYKLNITHWNTVEVEQFLMISILLAYFFASAWWIKKENPLALLRRSPFFGQSLAAGVGTFVESFAFLFAPASIILAAKRTTSVLWAVLSGHIVFHERRLLLKVKSLLLAVIGIILLTR